MIYSCVSDGYDLNMIKKSKDDHGECAFHAWKSLKDWYLDSLQKDQLVRHYESNLGNLVLNEDILATKFINHY